MNLVTICFQIIDDFGIALKYSLNVLRKINVL